MDNKASLTALMAAFARAYHSENSEEPVFFDKVVRKLITDEEYERMGKYIISGIEFFAPGKSFNGEREMLEYVVNTQLAPTPLARARFAEDSLRTAMQTGAEQYVILGAGLDTFAWRESALMQRLEVFEVDHPLTQADKRERLARAGLETPKSLRFVPIDLTKGGLREGLLAAGFDEGKKTFFSWLGASYYLSAEDIGALFESIASFAAEGSSVAFDYGDEGLFEAGEKRVQSMLAMAGAAGEPMKFCSGEMELAALLGERNFLIFEHMESGEINSAYYAGRKDGLSAFEHISYALAVLKGTQFINTKEKILRAALRLFAQNGYEAVSVKDIADELAITKGALYRHYKNKRDIFDSIVSRMEEQDRERAKEFEMPEGTMEEMAEAYRAARISALVTYSEAQFRRWTEDGFSSSFRKMLTLEQYRDAEMAALYRQYLAAGPLGYIEDIFLGITGDESSARRLAIEFYAPMFLLYSVYDGADSAARAGLATGLRSHFERMAQKLKLITNKE